MHLREQAIAKIASCLPQNDKWAEEGPEATAELVLNDWAEANGLDLRNYVPDKDVEEILEMLSTDALAL